MQALPKFAKRFENACYPQKIVPSCTQVVETICKVGCSLHCTSALINKRDAEEVQEEGVTFSNALAAFVTFTNCLTFMKHQHVCLKVHALREKKELSQESVLNAGPQTAVIWVVVRSSLEMGAQWP